MAGSLRLLPPLLRAPPSRGREELFEGRPPPSSPTALMFIFMGLTPVLTPTPAPSYS